MSFLTVLTIASVILNVVGVLVCLGWECGPIETMSISILAGVRWCLFLTLYHSASSATDFH